MKLKETFDFRLTNDNKIIKRQIISFVTPNKGINIENIGKNGNIPTNKYNKIINKLSILPNFTISPSILLQ